MTVRRPIQLLAALCILVSACAQTPAPVARHSAADARRFGEIVTLLAAPQMEGRGPGTAGLDKARDYLVGQFQAFGLQPAFSDSYTQRFEIDNGVEAVAQTLSIGDRALEPGLDFTPLGFSASSTFAGEPVFVGYGIVDKEREYDSYAGMPDGALNGRVAVAMRFEPQDDKAVSRWMERSGAWSRSASLVEKAKWAAERGAAAMLVVNPPSQQTPLKPTRQSSAPQTAAIPVLHITPAVFAQLGDADLAALQQAADRGESTFRKLAAMPIQGQVELKRAKAHVDNVAGVLPGAGALADDEVVVVGAHYDHLGYGDVGTLTRDDIGSLHAGADDNASGTAGLVMLAQRFAQNSSPVRRTMLFVGFSAEERGLLGSSHFLKHLDDVELRTDQIVAMVNMDMIGRMEKDRLYAFGIGSGDRWKSIIRTAAREHGLTLITDTSPLGASDHANFFMHKVPAVHFFTGVHSDYHRPTDTADKINRAGGAKALACIEQVVRELTVEQARLVFNAEGAKVPQRAHGAASGAFLGIMPDYATVDGSQGCGVGALTPGGPAGAAGVKDGDLIIQWNEHKIGNVYDLSGALRKGKPDEDVVLKIKRDGKIIDITVKLGQR